MESRLKPSRDCNHVSNEKLISMFKVNHRMQLGYYYLAAKSPTVRTRVEENGIVSPQLAKQSYWRISTYVRVLQELSFHSYAT